MTIKINTTTLAALDMVAAEQRVRTGKSLSISETISMLIERSFPHVTERVADIEQENDADGDKVKSEN